jgi:hypothetical protein
LLVDIKDVCFIESEESCRKHNIELRREVGGPTIFINVAKINNKDGKLNFGKEQSGFKNHVYGWNLRNEIFI